ncbi:MAG TPA: hypothetical protein PLE60_11245 [Candidatus Latescibacteria bacterium]|nr:hypothetical protein [Candidatus Latescibacterota bacterium]
MSLPESPHNRDLDVWLRDMTAGIATTILAEVSEDRILAEMEAQAGVSDGTVVRWLPHVQGQLHGTGMQSLNSGDACAEVVDRYRFRRPVPEDQGRAVLIFLASLFGLSDPSE